MRHAARQIFPGFHSKSLPLSTLLLAALCMVLAAPTSHAATREYSSSRNAILSVLQRSEISASLLQDVLAPQAKATSQLSLLEVRKLHALLSSLDQLQLLEIEKHLFALDEYSTEQEPLVEFQIIATPTTYSSPEPHLAAQLSGVRTNAFLE